MYKLYSFGFFALFALLGFSSLAFISLATVVFLLFNSSGDNRSLLDKEYFLLSIAAPLTTLLLFVSGSWIFALASGFFSYHFITNSKTFKTFLKNIRLNEKIKKNNENTKEKERENKNTIY